MSIQQSNTDALRHGSTGLVASFLTWLVGVGQWYSDHLPTLTQWIVHLAQLLGLVVAYYSIRILHRNFKNGNNTVDPKK